ncbi:BTAD domain-containing putative transcriptional regulator [Streptomyces sp. TE33382]
MEFQLLGPFQARDSGQPVLVGKRRQERCLLSILLLDAGRVVSTAHLVGLLWPGEPPAGARGTVHTYVGRLRAALAPHGLQVETVRDGYRVDPEPHTIDVRDFADLVRRADRAAEPGQRVRLYDEALALWRGPVLADVAEDALREQLVGHLEEQRLTAFEQRAEEHLALGLPDRVVADLTPLATRSPCRERLVAALMTALHATGRQADALALYRTTRQELVGELGIEPGSTLRGLHEGILRGDPGLDRPAGPVHAVRVGGEWLPWTTSGHPALEFCNTYAGWGGPPLPGAEWLRSHRTLAVWSGHHSLAEEWAVAGMLRRAETHPEEAAAALEEARRFRARLYACLADPDDVGAFNDVATVVNEAAAASVFVRGEGRLGHWRTTPAAGLRLPLAAVAREAAALLGEAGRFLVRACPGAGCGWLFLDESGRRRWCSLQTCGGRGTPVH